LSYCTYILRSAVTGRYYCGSTDDLERRTRQHNDPAYRGSKTTKRFEGPWGVVWHRAHATRSEAMALERRIKKRGNVDRLTSSVSGARLETGLESTMSVDR
jgi:putative endonuclease